jgi:hypothetical protein
MAYTTIDDPSAYFQAVTYTGGGNSSSVTFGGNSDLQPDFLWIKRRDSADNSKVMDTSRGVGSGNEPYLTTVSNEQEQSYNYLASMDSDGFTHNTTDSSTGASGNTYVAWGWKANGGSTTTNDASATSVGSIDSVYQANTTAGFSIVTYTGTGSAGTIAHGLGVVPTMIIIKERSSNSEWQVYHVGIGATKRLELNLTNAETTTSDTWNDTTPTSSVFSIGTSGEVAENTQTYVAYCFAEKQGYSKFGSYTGNGNADGPMVFCGLKPAWVLWKETGNSNDWYIIDGKINPSNQSDIKISPDSSDAESDGGGSYNGIDILSNGFKVRTSNSGNNRSGGTYIYMAFAEHPFVSSEGVPATAR